MMCELAMYADNFDSIFVGLKLVIYVWDFW